MKVLYTAKFFKDKTLKLKTLDQRFIFTWPQRNGFVQPIDDQKIKKFETT